MHLSINIHDRSTDKAVLNLFRARVRKIIRAIDQTIASVRMNKDAVGALEEASWHLEDLAGKKFWQLQSETELKDEIAAGVADEQIREANEARG